MIRALLLLALVASDAAAHGRDPFALRIHVRPGHVQDVIAATTIGLLTSNDGGATWRWTCEEALHYQDPFDPDYAIAATGSIFVQSFSGLAVNRNTCSYEPTSLGSLVISAIAAAADGAVYVAASATADSAIYKSVDDGVTFTPLATPGESGDWWRSLEVAPSDGQRIYLAGYRVDAMGKRANLLFVSRNGGTSFDAMNVTDFATTNDSMVEIAGIGGNPDVVYARVLYSPEGADAIYRSSDAGTSWAKVFSSPDPYGVAWLVRASGELVAATRASGAWRSSDDGATWQPLTNPPHISALTELPSGEVWAGTQNYMFTPPITALPTIPSDGYAIMKSSDLVSWTPVARLQELVGPACSTGDVHAECAATDRGLGTAWCCLASTLGITSTEEDCSGPRSCGAVAVDITVRPPEGCCQGTSQPAGLIVLIIFGYAYRSRRAACRRARGHR